MAWRMAKSLEILRAQINALSPNRDKSSDGGIGNAEHSSRTSDHNPNDAGVVCARDFTNDPAHGIDSEVMANKLLSSHDPRIKYLISNRKIASGDAGPQPWVWRKYTGANPHDHHFHISVKGDAQHYDDESSWKFELAVPPHVAAAPAVKADPVLRIGMTGPDVVRLQALLKPNEGEFDGRTKAAVEAFQKSHNIVADGVVGPYTWKALKNG